MWLRYINIGKVVILFGSVFLGRDTGRIINRRTVVSIFIVVHRMPIYPGFKTGVGGIIIHHIGIIIGGIRCREHRHTVADSRCIRHPIAVSRIHLEFTHQTDTRTLG